MSFYTKYQHSTVLHKSYVCVGLDSDFSRIPKFLKKEKYPQFAFNKEIVDATKNHTGAYKLNFAFYISQGVDGLIALEKTLDYIPKFVPTILDVKVGDIGNTMKGYAKAFFENLNVDSITANPLMGEDVINPLLEYKEKLIFLLALTSNKSAVDFIKKNDMYKSLSKFVAKHDPKNVGAVIGATNDKELKIIRKLMPESIYLIPGIGAQGGNLRAVMKHLAYSKKDARLLINSSRGIIFADESKDFAKAASEKTIDLKDKINQELV